MKRHHCRHTQLTGNKYFIDQMKKIPNIEIKNHKPFVLDFNFHL